jgi:hypothetical protein
MSLALNTELHFVAFEIKCFNFDKGTVGNLSGLRKIFCVTFSILVQRLCVLSLEFRNNGCLSQEVVGTLLGFDDFVNMVLEDVVEYESTSEAMPHSKHFF